MNAHPPQRWPVNTQRRKEPNDGGVGHGGVRLKNLWVWGRAQLNLIDKSKDIIRLRRKRRVCGGICIRHSLVLTHTSRRSNFQRDYMFFFLQGMKVWLYWFRCAALSGKPHFHAPFVSATLRSRPSLTATKYLRWRWSRRDGDDDERWFCFEFWNVMEVFGGSGRTNVAKMPLPEIMSLINK